MSLRQFVVTAFFFGVSLWPMVASICSQFYFELVCKPRLTSTCKMFYHEFFTLPKNGMLSKSLEINNNAKIMKDN